VALGEQRAKVLQVLSNVNGAEGRFDYIVSPIQRIMGIVDYAHTPDALLNVLTTIEQLRKGGEQIITVVGCGGDRDKSKRPEMGAVSCEHADKVIFTSDNPRSEDPMEIIRDMEAGLGSAARRKYLVIPDRAEAIKTALTLAGPRDIVLVAGKGHEKYQEIKGVKYPFDDKSVLIGLFALLEK
jgi:UDP-N-acetylmuramoyl-L-alanyl-D-glutamate--2,6-diaminopimelate ligase